MKKKKGKLEQGYSLIELILAMTLTLVLLSLASLILKGAFNIRAMETQRTNALVISQSVLNLMTREIANSGFGIKDNGLVIADSNQQQIHFRANIKNDDSLTKDPGEDITYSFDSSTKTIVRKDRFNNEPNSIIGSQVKSLTFQYLNYSNGVLSAGNIPSADTQRVRIGITIELEPNQGNPESQTITLISDTALLNSSRNLNKF
ncbi:MAG: prepilin-type N-terminal cleavage/methylation domain-containing protein [Pyrinomonadaceae bacterium]|nr:prepilin-type N-terminal cleavage/methylation domain-containing protein [Pyrinomonadaceae bacterium]